MYFCKLQAPRSACLCLAMRRRSAIGLPGGAGHMLLRRRCTGIGAGGTAARSLKARMEKPAQMLPHALTFVYVAQTTKAGLSTLKGLAQSDLNSKAAAFCGPGVPETVGRGVERVKQYLWEPQRPCLSVPERRGPRRRRACAGAALCRGLGPAPPPRGAARSLGLPWRPPLPPPLASATMRWTT